MTTNRNVKDLTGKRFGRLTVLSLSERMSGRKSFWLCECDCGNTKEVRSDSLGRISSCGCLKKEQNKINLANSRRHGETKTPLYNIWVGMRSRCRYDDGNTYARYGGRGIVVCEEWQRYELFREWALNNGYLEGLSLERINVDGNYEPSNCTWVTLEEQANNRRPTVWVDYQDKRQNLKQWCAELGLPYATIWHRYKSGVTPPELFSPINNHTGKSFKTTPR